MFKWSIATVCMGGTLETKLMAAAKAGFRAVEIFENDLTFFSGTARDAGAMAADLGLEIVALQPLRDFEAMPEPMRARNFERAERKLELMEALGTRLLCLCSNVSPEAIDDPDRAAEDLARLAERAMARGFRIGYEALAWGTHVKDWMAAWEIVRRADRANLGVVLDSFHICVRGNPLAGIAAIPGDRIALVQLADAPAIVMDPLSLSRHHRCFPGEGDLPLTAYLDAVVRSGYRGPVSLEVFNDQFRGAAASAIALDGMRSLQLAGETLHRERPEAALPAAPSGVALPPPPRVDGVEFVEFASSGAEAGRLAQLIQGLGFSRIARHRSKDVDLYRQNGVNIVINCEPDGFAHSFHLVHGTSVCAMALAFDDPAAALERANALGCSTYYGRIGPGEALIPAIGGIENSLIYFVSSAAGDAGIWDRDFAFAESATAPGPLKRIDHFSNVVRRSEFLSWLLFYKAVFAFRVEPQVEVADPYGALLSRVVSSPGGEVRIPLNVAEGGSTGVSRFIGAFGGAGIQQIAFATDDLMDFVERCRGRGVAFLAIPDNYYDDLAARYDLPPAMLERMRALDILYDRSKTGEFLHVYTATYEDRFFFEIVERRNYELFGAANTPVRLAAQAQSQDIETRSRALLGG
ncbi:MAG TPA: TIM barrel protein [Alphaproteobacteria bacterium]|nr:TIM barrel protein [Alphaproteobacteria bacterium]